MVKYVEHEVDRVKALFGQKERRLIAGHNESEQRVCMLEAEVDKAAADLKIAHAAAQEAQAVAKGAEAERVALGREVEQLRGVAEAARGRVAVVEDEMRLLLAAFEEEKAASNAKAAQLQAVLREWGSA
jgi:hypothetical protein